MNTTLPTGRRGRLLALGLLLVVLACVYELAAAPLLDLYAQRALTMQTQRTLLQKLDAVAGELPALRARLAALQGTAETSRLTLQGASDAIAAAALQGRIEELAAAAGMTIGSSESLPVKTQGPFHRIGLRLVLTGHYESLLKLLAKLETAAPPLVLDNLQIHALQRRPGTPAAAAADATLDASLEAYGFRADRTDLAKR